MIQRTMTLRQQHCISLPDARIAATALELSEPLVTRNIQDFHAIEGLALLNPLL